MIRAVKDELMLWGSDLSLKWLNPRDLKSTAIKLGAGFERVQAVPTDDVLLVYGYSDAK